MAIQETALAFAISQLGVHEQGGNNTGPEVDKYLSDMAWRDSNPVPGAIYILDHGGGVGHAGIVETVDSGNVLTEISGNTNKEGSREGNCVWRHNGQPEVSHGGTLLGYVLLDRALPLVA